MASILDPTLRSRHGKVVKALAIARISTDKQDERSNDDQIALCKSWLAERYEGPVEWETIKGEGSGELVDRKELFEAEAKVVSNTFDLIVVEDLGRICRRNRALDFCELCEDHAVRLIAINDHIDIAREDWRLNAFFAAFRHELYNKDTSARIKRTLRHRFGQGGVFQCTIFGYTKSDDARTDADVTKDPTAAPIYDEWFRWLEEGARYCEVADRLNSIGVPVGPYCRGNRCWTGAMVKRLTFNPILKGVRLRNVKESKRINETGHRRAVNAEPHLLLTRQCPHLAFIDPERYDRVTTMLQKRNEGYARGRRLKNPDCRKGVSRKRTAWPGQHVKCGICNRIFYWGGHGQKEHMMCSGCRDYRCWCSATFDGRDAAHRLTHAVLGEIEKLPDFESAFRDKIEARLDERRATRGADLQNVRGQLDEVRNQLGRVTDAIAKVGLDEILNEKLVSLRSHKSELESKICGLQRIPDNDVALPSMAQLKQYARESIENLAIGSPEFGRLMKRLVPKLKVYPYRLLDSESLDLRAELTLDLTTFTKLAETGKEADNVLRRTITVDLFDPPQRVKVREQVIAMRAEGLTERDVAHRLGITITAAQRSAALTRIMESQMQNDPYVAITTPPAGSIKFRRHLHERYRFEPLIENSEM
jgi:site-specific DNA recombinase